MATDLATQQEMVKNLTNTLTAKVQHMSENNDAFFLLVVSIVIYFMQCGFAFLECGAVRSKNATNILLKNILDSFFGAVAYWIIGYPLAFGGGNAFAGDQFWASHDMLDAQFSHWFFHFVFAATASTIISGAVAERCEFIAYVVYCLTITGVVYPIVTHWAWAAEGWLAVGTDITHDGKDYTIIYRDFAGSGVVHLLGGTCAFVGAALLGPRLGRFKKEDNELIDMTGHSVPLAALGGFILFFGFFAFNAGSQASISAEGDAAVIGLACINTIISGAFAAIVALLVQNTVSVCANNSTQWSLLTTINGGLAGMVAICAGCNAFYPWAACVTGIVAGFTYMAWRAFMIKLKIDDPLDAVAVHGGGGLWGLIAVPLLAKEQSVVMDYDKPALMSLAWNLAGAGAIIAWSAVMSTLVFGLLKAFKILRVSREIEIRGLDLPKHGEPAYPVISWGDGWGYPADTKQSPELLKGSGSSSNTDSVSQFGKEHTPERGNNNRKDDQGSATLDRYPDPTLKYNHQMSPERSVSPKGVLTHM